MIWEMLAGRFAFNGSVQVIFKGKAGMEDGLILPPELEVSPDLPELVRRCTGPDPAARPTAAEAAKALA